MNKEQRDAPVAALVASMLLIVYVISPIDFIPDFIPVIGWIDDVTLVILAASVALFAVWELSKPQSTDDRVLSRDVIDAEPMAEADEETAYEPIPADKLKAL